jgi:hypothetical protein
MAQAASASLILPRSALLAGLDRRWPQVEAVDWG